MKVVARIPYLGTEIEIRQERDGRLTVATPLGPATIPADILVRCGMTRARGFHRSATGKVHIVREYERGNLTLRCGRKVKYEDRDKPWEDYGEGKRPQVTCLRCIDNAAHFLGEWWT